MLPKRPALFIVLLTIALGCPAVFGQAEHSGSGNLPSRAAPAPYSPQSAGPDAAASTHPNQANPPAANPDDDCYNGNCDYQPPHISIATPAPAPAPWPWQDRILWGAQIVLVVLGYGGILMGLSLLRKIDRQTQYAETAAQAAQQSAQAAQESAKAVLAHAQAQARAERPWILMSVRPAPNVENGFSVVATNRGHGPARILSTVDEVVSAIDETHLSAAPVYRNQPVAPSDPLILLPGESTELVSFGRADVRRVCDTEERFLRVERWEEKIYLYGTVVYRDLAAPDNASPHQSSWFCWYIHGRQKSGMVMAGSPAYNRHT